MDNQDKTSENKPKRDEKGRLLKGFTANPNGRPEGSVSIVEGIKRKLLEIEPENKKTYLDLFLTRYFRKAIRDGDVGLIRDMINRIDGMPKQPVDNTGDVNININDYTDGDKHNTTAKAEAGTTRG